MGFQPSNSLNAIPEVHTRAEVKSLWLAFGSLQKTVSTLVRNNEAVVAYTPSSITLTAGAGLTGGGDLTADRSFAVGAGTGITVAADSVSISSSYLGANPTGTVGLSVVNGSATTYLRSDGAPALSQAIIPTWTGVHTFSAQDVHNAGVDLGTSGVFDSNVANAAAAASFKFQSTVAQTAGTDRYWFRLNDASGNSEMTVFSNGLVEFNGLAGSNTGFIQVAGTIPSGPHLGINFAPTSFTSSGTIGDFSTCVGGALFSVQPGSATSGTGGYFFAQGSGVGTQANVWAGEFESKYAGGAGNTVTSQGCLYLNVSATTTKGTVTTARGIYGAAFGTGPSATNRYWIDLTEITVTSGNRNSILLQQSGSASTYKALAFRDQDSWINSRDAAHLDLNATTSVDVNIGTTEQLAFTSNLMTIAGGVNIALATSTGTKIGTGTTQLLGFYNVTPVGQYATTGTVTGHTGGGGTALTHSDTFTGNTGSTAYTIGDIVRALKLWGAMAA